MLGDYDAGPYDVCHRCKKHKGRHTQGRFSLMCPKPEYDLENEARDLVTMADKMLGSGETLYDHQREFLTEVRDSSREFLRMAGHFDE